MEELGTFQLVSTSNSLKLKNHNNPRNREGFLCNK